MSLDKTETSLPAGGAGQAEASAREAAETWPLAPARACFLLASVVVAYMGVYLCRKNLSVAIPMIQKAFGVNKAQTGDIISYSAAAYAVGKFVFGPIIDRFGGRICLLLVMGGVAVFGGLGAFSGSIPMLVVCYSANRLCGSAGWGAIVKLTPAWFPRRHWALAMAFLSLSFVFGGVVALLLAGQIAKWSGDNWRVVMGLPSLVLLALMLVMWRIVPCDRKSTQAGRNAAGSSGFNVAYLIRLLKIPQLWVVCGMAFSLYIMRETFNDWTVDFFKTEGGAAMTSQVAAALSTPFDAAGAVGIMLLGWMFDKLHGRRRTIVLLLTLTLLAVLVYWLPFMYQLGLVAGRNHHWLDWFSVLWTLQPAGRSAGRGDRRSKRGRNRGGLGGLVRVRGHRLRRALFWLVAGSRGLPAGISRFGLRNAGVGHSLPWLEIQPNRPNLTCGWLRN